MQWACQESFIEGKSRECCSSALLIKHPPCGALPLLLLSLQENIKSVVAHLVESFGSWVSSVDYVESFRMLKMKHEQVQHCKDEVRAGTAL